jgi:hypothetical protein
MTYMQGMGSNDNLLSSTASVTMESDFSKSVSTLSSNFSNIHKSVDRLVEVHEKQIRIQKEAHEKQIQIQREHNEFIEKKFNKLIECLSGGVTVQSAHTGLCFDDPSVEFGINERHHDGSFGVLLKRPDGKNSDINLPPSSVIFKDIGGAVRKTEEKNPPIYLLEFLLVAGWELFLDDKQKFIIPFFLKWPSKESGVNVVNQWLSELDGWSCGKKLARILCVGMVIVESKPCVAIYYKCLDETEDIRKPVLSLLAPQSLKNTDLPLKELEELFGNILSAEDDDPESAMLTVQKVFFPDDNSKILDSAVGTGVKVKDFMVNFTMEKRAKTRNELSDALFWFVIICCCGKKSDNIFSQLKDELVGFHRKDDPAAFRRTICNAIYDSVVFLAKKKYISLKNNHWGVAFSEKASVKDFVDELQKQKELIPSSGKNHNDVFVTFYLSC